MWYAFIRLLWLIAVPETNKNGRQDVQEIN